MKNYTQAEIKMLEDYADYRLYEGDRLLKKEDFEQANEAYQEALSIRRRLFKAHAFEFLHSVGACMGKLVDAAMTRGDRETAVEWIRKMTPLMVCGALCSGDPDAWREAAKACVRQAIYEEDGWTTYRLYQQALEHYEAVPEEEWSWDDIVRELDILGELCIPLDEEPVPPSDPVVIPDEGPMAEVPRTGDISGLWYVLFFLTGGGLIGLLAGRKGKEEA